MKQLLLILSLALAACAKSPTIEELPPQDPPVAPAQYEALWHGVKFVDVGTSAHGFILPATVNTGRMKWVWYAPAFMPNTGGLTPANIQQQFYFDSLRSQGFTIVGMDIGESFGSPAGRALYKAFYDQLMLMGYESTGVFYLQSRGNLMGYSFLKAYPVASAVVSIYPLFSFDDYIGPTGYAPRWGVSLSDFALMRDEYEPLHNASQFASIPKLMVHGDADTTTHLSFTQAFQAQAGGTLIVVPGEGHENSSPNFFARPDVLTFINQF